MRFRILSGQEPSRWAARGKRPRGVALALIFLASWASVASLAGEVATTGDEAVPSSPDGWLRLAEAAAPAAPAANWERARTIIAAGWIAVADLAAVREFSDRSGWTHLQRGAGLIRRVPVPESRGEFSLHEVLVALARLGRPDLAVDAALRVPRTHDAGSDTFGDPDEADFSLLLARLAFDLPAELAPTTRAVTPLHRLWEGSERARRDIADAASSARVGLDRIRLALEREQSFLAWEAATALAPESGAAPPPLDPPRTADLVVAFVATGDAVAAERLALTLGSPEFRQRALIDAARAWAARQEPTRARRLLAELPDDYPRRLGAGVPLAGLASVPITLAERWSGVDWRERLVSDPGLPAAKGVPRTSLPDVWHIVAAAVRGDSAGVESGMKALPSEGLRRRAARLAKEESARRESASDPGTGIPLAKGSDPVPAALKAAAEGDERALRGLLEPAATGTNRRHAVRLRLLAAPETAPFTRLAREVIDAETNPANRAELLAARALALLPRR